VLPAFLCKLGGYVLWIYIWAWFLRTASQMNIRRILKGTCGSRELDGGRDRRDERRPQFWKDQSIRRASYRARLRWPIRIGTEQRKHGSGSSHEAMMASSLGF
jgi:hypothetical protein